jgi:hypothetical protein
MELLKPKVCQYMGRVQEFALKKKEDSLCFLQRAGLEVKTN